jgi:hypothetical protein
MKNSRSQEALGTLAFNGGTQDIVAGKSLAKTYRKTINISLRPANH